MTKAEYQKYLASRRWAQKREAIRRRSGNTCERCLERPMDAVHHLTYEHIGHEPLADLIAICDDCHQFLSGKSTHDPARLLSRVVMGEIEKQADEYVEALGGSAP